MNDYPAAITAVSHVEPVPRRIRAFLAGEKVLDTTGALYVWEWPYYPHYYIPVADVRRDLLIPEGRTQHSRRGTAEAHAPPQHGHSFTLLRRGRARSPARGPPFLRITGPAQMWLGTHGGLGLPAFTQARQAVLRPLIGWRPGRPSASLAEGRQFDPVPDHSI